MDKAQAEPNNIEQIRLTELLGQKTDALQPIKPRKTVFMNLNFPSKWRFEGSGIKIPREARNVFQEILEKMAAGKKSVIEEFKDFFGAEGESTSYSWAQTDLSNAMQTSAENAPLFLESLWKCIESAGIRGIPVPELSFVNSILKSNGVPLILSPPNIELASDSIVTEKQEEAVESPKALPFILKDKIGEGGFGVVYKAIRTTSIDEFEYAVKFLDPVPFNLNYDEAIKRFQREVKIIRSLQHKSIIHYYEAGVSQDKKPYLVMQLIEGRSLRDAMSSVNLVDALSMYVEVLYALEYAHSKGVIHRDLKPSNIIVRNSDNQPIILDFGAAYILDGIDTNTLTTHQVGTFGYIPSEILAQPALRSPLQDVYACGMILYEAFAGHLADPADYKPLSLIREELSLIDPIITAAIAGQSQRINSARLLADQVRQAIRHIRMSKEEAAPSYQALLNVNSTNATFSDDELQVFRIFSDALVGCYSQIRNDAIFLSSPDEIITALEEVFGDSCLNSTISDIPKLAQCFVSGVFRYNKQQVFVTDLRSFIDLLRAGNQFKQSLIFRNLFAKLRLIKTYSAPKDDDLPF